MDMFYILIFWIFLPMINYKIIVELITELFKPGIITNFKSKNTGNLFMLSAIGTLTCGLFSWTCHASMLNMLSYNLLVIVALNATFFCFIILLGIIVLSTIEQEKNAIPITPISSRKH